MTEPDVRADARYGAPPVEYGLTVEVVNVQPEQAKVWLQNNGHHRDTKPKLVKKYADRMVKGEWMLNGKTIVFDTTGKLIGGQHRLMACAKSGAPFLTLIVRGVDPAVLDQEKE